MGSWSSMEIISREFKIISIKKFYHVNFIQRIKINQILEYNYRRYYKIIPGYNYPIYNTNGGFFKKLYGKFLSNSKKIFKEFDLSHKNKDTCWCYRSFGEEYQSIYHNHVKSSVINGVYYYQVNKNDSINFIKDGREFEYFPSNEELLIFPNHLEHKPNKPNGNNYRYSINMEIITEQPSYQIFSGI